jgi:putative acyl-CoA dehydrogenase
MAHRAPTQRLTTHEVHNQPPPMGDVDLYFTDPVLQAALHRENAGWAEDTMSEFGALIGSEAARELGHAANRFPPELVTHDRYGQRVDEVHFHPAYHELMRYAMEYGTHAIAWTSEEDGRHVIHAALQYILTQTEAGVCCPMAMTYAAIPPLRLHPALAQVWEPRLTSRDYDPRFIPADEKAGATAGMAMTEKQGGSDVRTNTTRATPIGLSNEEFELVGHKWFCSAPMSDAFFTLAQTKQGLSCFFVPRWRPDGTRNPFFIQRLKDKLGNRSNASSEIEYNGTFAYLVGGEGEGVRTIIDMVHHTRLDAAVVAAGMMRQAVITAAFHTAHRTAFQKKLIDQALMRNVLADMALEWEGATTLIFRVARAYDASLANPADQAFARLAVAAAKFWINKRLPNLVYEAMECLGGVGYVEESYMPRLYREAPVNSIWEGSGNVICLDVLRSLERAPAAKDALIAELAPVRGADSRLDAAIAALTDKLSNGAVAELDARQLTEEMALVLQGALLVQHAPSAVSDAFIASRLAGEWGRTYGTLARGADLDGIIERIGLEHIAV